MTSDQERLGAYANTISAFTERSLRPYLQRRAADRTPLRSKEFNDPIWGTLKFHGAEVVILDSPLLQRLRRIRQLGVAHLVYPAAVHTRLEHSLGTAHQVEALAASIESHSTDHARSPGDGNLQEWHVPLLRLTALCHDVGHGLMSHVSENALDQNRACVDLRLSFQNHVQSSRSNQLSEIAAYYIFQSPAFLELLRLADHLSGGRRFVQISTNHIAADKMIHYRDAMMNLVIGEQIDDQFPLIHELISGPFDADKLDYMTRDANMCGVPVVTDVARLIQKVRIVNLSPAELPEEIAARGSLQQNCYRITGIARSGARTLDELALGRALLFDKIYRHQKVRAAESMVASIIQELLAIDPSNAATIPLRLVDEDLFMLSRENARTVLQLSKNIEPNTQADLNLQTALDLAARLRDRQLLVRGFAFSSKMPMDPYRDDPEQHAGVERLNRLTTNPSERADFVRQLVDLANEIAMKSGEPMPASVVPSGRVEPYIWISAPTVADGTGGSSQIGHAWLIGEYGEPISRADQDYAETRGWSDAYVATRDLGLIFCPQEMAPSIYLAAETLVRQRFNVRTPVSMRAFAKQDPDRLRTIQESLARAGFYDDKPRDLAPEPSVLRRPDADKRIERILERLSGYSGPLMVDPDTRKRRDPRLTKERIRHWLRQFSQDLVEAAMEMLEAVTYIGREEINSALDAFVSSNEDYVDSSLTPLGQPKDSSSVLTYFGGDPMSHANIVIRSLEDALLRPLPVIMVDDYVGRGSAAITILEDWLGTDSTQELHQDRGTPLPIETAALLKKKQICLVFAAGRSDGAEAIRRRAVELGFERLEVYIHREELPSLLAPCVISNDGLREKLLAFCKDRGKEALIHGGSSSEIAEERALGYGNQGLLMVSSFNTPTAAVTCLWHDGPDWAALFPRRPKR